MMLRNIFVMLLAALLLAGSADCYAQQKKTKSQPKTTKTQQKSTKKTTSKTTTQKSQATKKSEKPAASSAPTKKLSRAEYEKQQRDLQKQIAATEKMISENDKSVMAQNRDIQLRKDEIGKRRALLVAMQLEIEAIQVEQDSLTQLIADLTEDYQNKQQKFAAAMKHMFKWRSGYDELAFVLSAEDMQTSVRRFNYLKEYSEWRKKQARQIVQQREATEEAKAQLEQVRADREAVKKNLEREKQALSDKQRIQEEAVSNLKKRNKELKGELETAQKKQREIQKKIQQMIDEERRKAEEARKKSEGKGSTGSNTGSGSSGSSKDAALTYYSPAEVAQLTGSFRQNKGKMPYPVDANYAFLSHYTADGNYSINLSTSVGAHACAVFEGTVIRVARSSEDYTIIINHGEYMTVYSNLSSANVKEGEKVKMRQTIGTVKADTDNRRAVLLFWIYGKTDAENPESWLKK